MTPFGSERFADTDFSHPFADAREAESRKVQGGNQQHDGEQKNGSAAGLLDAVVHRFRSRAPVAYRNQYPVGSGA